MKTKKLLLIIFITKTIFNVKKTKELINSLKKDVTEKALKNPDSKNDANNIENYKAIAIIDKEETDIQEKFNEAFQNSEKSNFKILEESRKNKDFIITYDEKKNEIFTFVPKLLRVIGISSSEEENEVVNDNIQKNEKNPENKINQISLIREENEKNLNPVKNSKKKKILNAIGGMTFEIGKEILYQIKNYFLPNLIKLFQNINFPLKYEANILSIKKVNVQIPLHLLEKIKENIILSLDSQNQSIIISFIKLPLLINLDSFIKNIFLGKDFKGLIIIITIINLIEIKLNFVKIYHKNFFKPKIFLKLSHWDIDSSNLKITTDIEKLPNFVFDIIADILKNNILGKLKDTIKELLPTKITALVNEKIEDHLNDFFPIGGEKSKLAINILCTKIPSINKNSISYFISGEFFYSDDENYIPGTFENEPVSVLQLEKNILKNKIDYFISEKIKKYIKLNVEKKEKVLKEEKSLIKYQDILLPLLNEPEKIELETLEKLINKNFDLSLTKKCLENFIHLYMGNSLHNTFLITITYIQYKLRLNLFSSKITIKNQSLFITNINIKFFKQVFNSEIGTEITVNLKGQLKFIDLSKGKVEVKYEKIDSYENPVINNIVDYVAKTLIPGVFKFKPVILPFGIKLGSIESVFEKGVHLMSNLEVGEVEYSDIVKQFLYKKVLDFKVNKMII